MRIQKANTTTLAGILILAAIPAVAQTHPADFPRYLRSQTTPPQQTQASVRIGLQDLERMALASNPTLKQAEARIRAAQGKMKQAGLYPNPTAGYTGDEISRGPIIRGGEHGFFVDQSVVLGGKLGKRRDVQRQAVLQAETEAEIQRYRVLNAVRRLFFEVLAAERRVELRERLLALADEAVKTSHGLYNVGQSDRTDVLEAEIEAQQAGLAREKERNELAKTWQQLLAVVDDPVLAPSRLAGQLDAPLPDIDAAAMLADFLRSSPEVKLAQAGVQRASSTVRLARAERIPDILARGGLRYNRELLELGATPVGWEGFADVGVKIPLFNRNQGNIEAAQSEQVFAEQELRRVQMSIRSRFSQSLEQYKTARRIVETYKSEVIPRAEQAHDLYLAKFKEMGAAYPQVLIAQRTLFQVSIGYVSALENFWEAVVLLQGFLLADDLVPPRSYLDSVSEVGSGSYSETER